MTMLHIELSPMIYCGKSYMIHSLPSFVLTLANVFIILSLVLKYILEMYKEVSKYISMKFLFGIIVPELD